MPGLRAAVGAERRVRVSLVLAGDTGLPTSLSGVDPWSGSRYSFERSMLGKSGGAWLGSEDRGRMDLQHNGRYQVVARLYEPGLRGPSSRVIDTVDVVLDGPSMQVVTAKVNQRAIDSALAELRRRAQR